MTGPRIAVVGTTRAGKSVFITTLAKYLEHIRDGARLSPRGGSPKNTYIQIEEWWNELQAGNWLPPTPPGTLIEMNWELALEGKSIPLQMFDYAGETLTDLFNNKADSAEGAARDYFDKVRKAFESASVLLVLLNLEALIEQGVGRATETKATLVMAMTAFLEKIKSDKRDCRVCFVFTSYDRYEAIIQQRWGTVGAFLQRELPPLYYEFADKNPNVHVLPVAAVSETETRIDPHTGAATLYPKPGFRSRGFEKIVRWLVQATSDSKAELDENAEGVRQDEQNKQFLQELSQAWENVRHSTQLELVSRFLGEASKPFPYPTRPNVSELGLQLRPIFDAAKEVKSRLLADSHATRWKKVKKVFQALAATAAMLVGGRYAAQAFKSMEEARLRGPSPQSIAGEKASAEWACNKGIVDCWEHRVVVKVPVWNNGGAGNIAVTVKAGDRSETVTKFFNQGEKATVYVRFNNLPNHDSFSWSYSYDAAQ